MLARAFRHYVEKCQLAMIRAMDMGGFRAPEPFSHLHELVKPTWATATRWARAGFSPPRCSSLSTPAPETSSAQPFGCLPNHVVGKGMIRALKDDHPMSNIVAIDYDAGATKINQENRIKLMLANARRIASGGHEKEAAHA